MKRYYTSLLLVLITLIAYAQYPQGVVLESQQMESKIMKEGVKYTIYLPPGYKSMLRKYPVVYLLHGFSGNDTDWVQHGALEHIVNKAIAEGDIPPMIIVMPDGGNNWYVNSSDGKVMYEDMFIKEFIPFIEKEYHIRGTKEFRGIAGLSMGGYGSMVMALRHPDLFAASAPLSAGILRNKQLVDLEQERYDNFFGIPFGTGHKKEDRLSKHYLSYSPLQIVQNSHADSIARVRFYIDCGDDDILTVGNSELHILMTEKEIPHEYRVRDGAHQWEYWRKTLPDALKFISESFTR